MDDTIDRFLVMWLVCCVNCCETVVELVFLEPFDVFRLDCVLDAVCSRLSLQSAVCNVCMHMYNCMFLYGLETWYSKP
jgi:hypothetical protein